MNGAEVIAGRFAIVRPWHEETWARFVRPWMS